jgi:hypothetical protein
MKTATAKTNTTTAAHHAIVAIDLGKYKSVAGIYQSVAAP